MVKIYKQPFAHDGDTIAIPDASQPDGKMSNVDGWTPDYQLPKTDPNYKPVDRQEMNGVFKEVTEALGQVQVQGAASWSADGAPYPANAQVYHNGKQWISLRANSVVPAEGADWTELVGKQYVNGQLLGVGQTWQSVVRTPDTTYTNTTGRPIMLSISAFKGSGPVGERVGLALDVGGETIQRAISYNATTSGGVNCSVSGVIPAGDTYSFENLTIGSGLALNTYELR